MRENPCGKCCVGNVIYSDKCGKTIVRGMVNAAINNIIYMKLYSGPKMAHGKCGKTNVVGTIDRDSIVFSDP
jgi:hypothetical protein